MAETALQKSENRPQEARDLSHQMLGAAKYATVLHKQTASDLIRFLITVRDEKRFLDYDCDTFEAFLDSAHSPISKSSFYRQLDLFNREGENYDLLEEWKVPVRIRKQLTAGDVTINGSEVLIGGEQVSIGDNPTIIRQIFERMVKEKIATDKQLSKLQDVEDRYKKLRAEVEQASDDPEYVVAFLQWIKATNILVAEVKDLPGEVKGERGPLDVPQIITLMEQVFNAYGEASPWLRA